MHSSTCTYILIYIRIYICMDIIYIYICIYRYIYINLQYSTDIFPNIAPPSFFMTNKILINSYDRDLSSLISI